MNAPLDGPPVSHITDDTWYCTHPRERETEPGGVLPEAEQCSHEECRPPGPQVLLDAEPARSAVMATPDEWCTRYGVVVHGPDGWRRDSKSWNEPITEEEFWQRVAWSSCEMPALRAPIDDLRRDLARQRAIAEDVAADSTATAGAPVSPVPATDHADNRVSPVTDDMVEEAAIQLHIESRDPTHRDWTRLSEADRDVFRQYAKAALSAALAGCTPVVLPEPDDRSVHAWVTYWNDNPETLPQEERFALQKLANILAARRLAGSVSPKGDNTDGQ